MLMLVRCVSLFSVERWIQKLTVIPPLIGCVCVCVCNINGDTISTLDSFPKFLFFDHSFSPLFFLRFIGCVVLVVVVDKRCLKIGYDHEPKLTTYSRIYHFFLSVVVFALNVQHYYYLLLSWFSANSTCFNWNHHQHQHCVCYYNDGI